MDSTVCMRKNHYETLGLKPTASDQEIREGFARTMRLPHRPKELAQIGIAFDTLRNSAKRRAYDEAMGLLTKPQPRIAAPAISLRFSGNLGGLGTASLKQPKPPLETAVRERPIQPMSGPEDRLRKSTFEHDGFAPEVPIPEFLATNATPKRSAPVRKQSTIDWKYPAFALGPVVLGVALIGAWAGAHAQDTPERVQASTMMAALPPVKGRPETLEVPPSSNSSAEPQFISPALIEHARQRLRARATVDRHVVSGTPESPVGGPGDAVAQQPRAVAARLPLPNAVIVRTIERIGYACGRVASATAADGDEPGAYKITCTSGQSYQARPVHGRYHFKRW